MSVEGPITIGLHVVRSECDLSPDSVSDECGECHMLLVTGNTPRGDDYSDAAYRSSWANDHLTWKGSSWVIRSGIQRWREFQSGLSESYSMILASFTAVKRTQRAKSPVKFALKGAKISCTGRKVKSRTHEMVLNSWLLPVLYRNTVKQCTV